MTHDPNKIKFPCQWEFRLVALAETMDLTKAAVLEIGKAENAGFRISDGGSSGGGKYSTLRIGCEVDCLERARSLAEMLQKVEGVRFLI